MFTCADHNATTRTLPRLSRRYVRVSPTLLKLKSKSTSSVLSQSAGYQFDTLFGNNKFVQFAFSNILLLMVNDTYL